MSRPSRRRFLQALAATGITLAAPAARPAPGHRFQTDPFTLGVASGYPRPDGMVLWTRLAPSPLRPDGGMPQAAIPVAWEVAADDAFKSIVLRGTAQAEAALAHSVHVEPFGLEPNRPYWYRFRAGGALSPAGRTRTAPAVRAFSDRLRLAVASCQMYEHGFYTAYRHMAGQDYDLILHLGDYIYENSWGADPVRRHGTPEPRTLDDYRARYALYKTDPDLQAAHAAAPWLTTWDDHEVDNDYAGAVAQDRQPPEKFLARRAAAYQAYYEHLPLPRAARPAGADMRVHTEFSWGDLAHIALLDGRQYRTPHACPPPRRRGGSRVAAADCAALAEPSRSMLGAAQEDWLYSALQRARNPWHLLAQQTVMTHIDEDPGPGRSYWTDAWNGYPAARQRLLDTFAERRIDNPVVFSGDIHAFMASDLHRIADDVDTPVIASELVTTSISSHGRPQEMFDKFRALNPNIHFADSRRRGYLALELSRARLTADMLAVDTANARPGAVPARRLARHVVAAGRPGIVPG